MPIVVVLSAPVVTVPVGPVEDMLPTNPPGPVVLVLVALPVVVPPPVVVVTLEPPGPPAPLVDVVFVSVEPLALESVGESVSGGP